MGIITSPAFYLFTFFMLTDPVQHRHPRAEVRYSWRFFIAALDFYLHQFETLSTLFKAAFVYFSLVWIAQNISHTKVNFIYRNSI